ncbi:MAG: GNVR domain-containing protein [Planctomycetota bacterium]
MEKSENYLRLFTITLFANKRLILWVTVLFAIFSVLVALFFPPIYYLQGQLVVNAKKIMAPPESTQMDRGGASANLPPTTEDTILETLIVTSPPLIQESIKELRSEGAVFTPSPLNRITKPFGSIFKPISEAVSGKQAVLTEEEELALEIGDKLTAEIVPGANAISVSLLYHDAELGVSIVNRILNNYLEFRRAIFSKTSAGEDYGKQIARYRAELERLNSQKVALMEEHRISDVTAELQGLMSLINDFSQTLSQMEDDYYGQLKNVEYLNGVLSRFESDERNAMEPFPEDMENREINSYRDHLNTLLFQYSDAVKTYREDSVKIQALTAQIRKDHEKMLMLVKNFIDSQGEALRTKKDLIENKKLRLKELQDRSLELKEAQIQIEQIDTDIALTRANYETFSNRLEETRIESASQFSQAANVQILSRALVPTEPFFPKPRFVIPLGILAGFILGFALAWIKQFFDHTFKTAVDVEQHLQLPVIGSLILD